MKAIVYRKYGSPDVLTYEDIEKPTAGDDEVLVKVRAASVNPFDWHFMRGMPYFMRVTSGLGKPKTSRLGADVVGQVEAVGKNVTQFKPGDEVFGSARGSFAQYVTAPASRLVTKPDNLTFEQAAAVPIAAVTALEGLRNKGNVQQGQKVLINGASGGVGTFAVQIAKVLGADVTGICSTRNVELVRSLGADQVIDYTKENFTSSAQRFDVILDNIGNHPLSTLRRVLNPKGKYVMVGGPSGRWAAPLDRGIRAAMMSLFVSQDMGLLFVSNWNESLAAVRELIEAGKLMPVIDKRYPLSEVPDAIRYLEKGHARGKVVISVG